MDCEEAISVGSNENQKPLPHDISILLLDGDPTSLIIIAKMLCVSGYKVVTAKRAADALCILRERKDELHLVLAEAHLPDMDRFELLDTVGEMSNLPVIMMSADKNENSMLGSLCKGAVLYLVKPLTMKNIKDLWQFVFLKKRETSTRSEGQSNSQGDVSMQNASDEIESQPKLPYIGEKRKEPEVINQNGENKSSGVIFKKRKLVWTDDLHNRFLQAIKVLGIDGAHPKKILQHMNVPGLRKENISSHLQKYRLSLKREQEAYGKTMSSHYLGMQHLSGMFNLYGGFLEFSEFQYPTTLQPEIRNHFQNNFRGYMPVPSPEPANFLNNMAPSSNGILHANVMQMGLPSNGMHFANMDPSRAAFRVTNGGQLSSFNHMGIPGVGDFGGFEQPIQYPTMLTNFNVMQEQQQQQQQQQQLLLPQLPQQGPQAPTQEPEEHDIFGMEGGEIGELFDMNIGVLQELLEDDLYNLW